MELIWTVTVDIGCLTTPELQEGAEEELKKFWPDSSRQKWMDVELDPNPLTSEKAQRRLNTLLTDPDNGKNDYCLQKLFLHQEIQGASKIHSLTSEYTEWVRIGMLHLTNPGGGGGLQGREIRYDKGGVPNKVFSFPYSNVDVKCVLGYHIRSRKPAVGTEGTTE